MLQHNKERRQVRYAEVQFTLRFVMLKHNLQSLQSLDSRSVGDWSSIAAESVRDPAELCRLLDLDASWAAEAIAASGGFPLLVPRPYLARIRPGDPSDPLLLQVIPRKAETAAAPGFDLDPLREADAQCEPGLLRKYQGRLLIVATGACSVHCRFCFRRHFFSDICDRKPLKTDVPITCKSPRCEGFGASNDILRSAVRRTASDPTIEEVILSGGDPLMLPDEDLASFARQLARVAHVRRLRIHSRLPVTIPQRITRGMIRWIRAAGIPVFLVVHVNHPAEIDDGVAEALGRLVDAGIPVLSQSVLLRGVNDRAEVLAELFRRLVDLRVLPYYLHQLDTVAGAAHFEVSQAVGEVLVAELRARLPGYAVPRYVRETPGGHCKEILA